MERCFPQPLSSHLYPMELHDGVDEGCPNRDTTPQPRGQRYPDPCDGISVIAAAGPAVSLQGCHPEHPREGHLGLGRPDPPATSHAPREARTENITFIVHDQLYKRNVPTCARVRGPFHKRALEKARERARKRRGGSSVGCTKVAVFPTWHKGCAPSPPCPPRVG